MIQNMGWQALSLALIMSLATACSPRKQSSTVKIQLPKSFVASSKPSLQNLVRASEDEVPWLGSISDYTEINCYIVAVGAEEAEMSQNECMDNSSNNTAFKFGPYVGGVPEGDTISIKVPTGKKRTFYLLGTYAESGYCKSFSGDGPTQDKLTHPRILATQTTDLESGKNKSLKFNVPADLSSLTEIGDCDVKDQRDIGDNPSNPDDTTNPPPPAPASLSLAVVSGDETAMHITGGASPGTALAFRVTNVGASNSSDLNGATSISGDTTNFNVLTNTCTSFLTPGAFCDITIEPIAVMNKSYSASLMVSSENNPSLTLSGTSSGFALPVAVLSGEPGGAYYSGALAVSVGGADIVEYSYKVGSYASTECSNVSGYSAAIPVATAITDLPADSPVTTLCVIGKNSVNVWQTEASATNVTWFQDSTPPNVVISLVSAPNVFPQTIQFDFDEDISGFGTEDLAIGTGLTLDTGSFSLTGANQYQVDIHPDSPSETVQVDVMPGGAMDNAGNGNVAPATFTVAYNADVTVDPIDWIDFTTESSDEVFSGFDHPLHIQLSVVYDIGVPTVEYQLNGGPKTSFTNATPADLTDIQMGDTLKLWVNGGLLGDEATITVTNLTDSGVAVDTAAGTFDPCFSTIGSDCIGGGYYAGLLNTYKYMVTEGNCDDSASPTCITGADTLNKAWYGTSGTLVDITSILNITNDFDIDTVTGDILTSNMVADGSVSADSAAHYCDNMLYLGYSDWYLPSKTELAFLYCNAAGTASHNVAYPQENPDCNTYGDGGTKAFLIPDFDNDFYWASSESSGVT